MLALRRFLPKNVTVAKNFSLALTCPPPHKDDAPSADDASSKEYLKSHESQEDDVAHHEKKTDPALQERTANKSAKDSIKAAETAAGKVIEEEHASYSRSP